MAIAWYYQTQNGRTLCLSRLAQEGEQRLLALETQRQESAAELKQLRASLSKAYSQLKTKVGPPHLYFTPCCESLCVFACKVTEGLEKLRKEEEVFVQAHQSSITQLNQALSSLRVQYDEETNRIAQGEAIQQRARQKKLLLLQRWSEAISFVGSRVIEAQLESDGNTWPLSTLYSLWSPKVHLLSLWFCPPSPLGRLYAEVLRHGDPELAFVRAKVEAESSTSKADCPLRTEGNTLRNGDRSREKGVPKANAEVSFELMCCYRLYLTTRAHADPSDAAAPSSDSHCEQQRMGSLFDWFWMCAPLDELLQIISRGEDAVATGPLHHRLSPGISVHLQPPQGAALPHAGLDSLEEDEEERLREEQLGTCAALLCSVQGRTTPADKPSEGGMDCCKYLVLYDILHTQVKPAQCFHPYDCFGSLKITRVAGRRPCRHALAVGQLRSRDGAF